MITKIKQLQKTQALLNPLNVDPVNDGPEDLQAYAKEYKVDLATWDFETNQSLSVQSFQAALESGAAGQMSHSYMFYLINPDGEVVKMYDGMSINENNNLIADLKSFYNY